MSPLSYRLITTRKANKMFLPLVAVATTNPLALAIAIVGMASFIAIALPISLVIEKVRETNATKKAIAYRLANQCKGITKKGEQCLNWSDCPHHSN